MKFTSKNSIRQKGEINPQFSTQSNFPFVCGYCLRYFFKLALLDRPLHVL